MKSTTVTARPLPTRKTRALSASANHTSQSAVESRQESRADPLTPGSAEEERVPSPDRRSPTRGGTARAEAKTAVGGGGGGGMKPAFVLGRGVPTLPVGRRSPSPATSAVSRRGRSRSPVGMTRNGSSRSNSRSNARTDLRTPTASNARSGELSSAALKAGEAAANASMSPAPRRGGGVGGVGGGGDDAERSPSPPLARFPSLAHGSFEVGTNLSMSFGASFEWGGGAPAAPAGGGRQQSGGGYDHGFPGHYPPGGGYGPPTASAGGYDGYHGGHGRRSPSPAERYRGGYEGRDGSRERYYSHHPPQPHGGYYGGAREGYSQGGGGYGAYHHGQQRHYSRGRSPSPTGR